MQKPGGEEATIKSAITELGIKDVIVGGHTRCGAIKGLLAPADGLKDMRRSSTGYRAPRPPAASYQGEVQAILSDLALLTAAARRNVLVQLENLRTHPAVAAGLSDRKVKLRGCIGSTLGRCSPSTRRMASSSRSRPVPAGAYFIAPRLR